MNTDMIHTCASCGAEESLDALLLRMIDDDTTRRLIADLICQSIPLGVLVVRYLRLHKPAKQRLRLSKVQALLGELVPVIKSGQLTRAGRDWAISIEQWREALHAVFSAEQKGALNLPLEGNGYLYQIAMRLANQDEARAEQERETDRRHRGSVSGPGTHAAAIAAAAISQAPALHTVPSVAVGSIAVREAKARMAAIRNRTSDEGDPA